MAIIKWFCSFPLFTYYKYLESIMRLAKEKNKEANSNITKKRSSVTGQAGVRVV